MSGRTLLKFEGISKTFPGGVTANENISFSVERGQIHGLLGENGAGKSTLMNVLYGLHNPDSGRILFEGVPLEADNPKQAIDVGIGMVHQHFKLIPELSVRKNIILGRREGKRITDSIPILDGTSGFMNSLMHLFSLDLSGVDTRLNRLQDQYGFDLDLDTPVRELDVGEQQQVEILKSLYSDVSLLILDEPTAVLSPAQRTDLFSTLRVLVDNGLTIICITHKLEAVTAIADKITILRDGTVIDTVETDVTTNSELAEMMVGRNVSLEHGGVNSGNIDNHTTSTDNRGDSDNETTGRLLESRDLDHDDGQRSILNEINLTVSSGEIVGIAGVSGNGQKELVECLAGLRDASDGKILFKNTDVTGHRPSELIERGLSYIPEDRLEVGCAPDQSVMYNAIMKDPKFKSDFIFDEEEAKSYARDIIDTFDVRVSDQNVPAGKLSGGNLQKLIVGREITLEPDVLIANKPTRGLDVGAIEYIFSVLTRRRDTGMGILMVSGELDHLLNICDRILVMYEGEIVYRTRADDAEKEVISRYMTDGSR